MAVNKFLIGLKLMSNFIKYNMLFQFQDPTMENVHLQHIVTLMWNQDFQQPFHTVHVLLNIFLPCQLLRYSTSAWTLCDHCLHWVTPRQFNSNLRAAKHINLSYHNKIYLTIIHSLNIFKYTIKYHKLTLTN